MLPYVAYVGIAAVPVDWLPRDWNYVARIVATAAALAWAWPRLIPWRGPGALRVSLGAGVLMGVVGLGVWLLLMAPFVEKDEAWDPGAFWLRLAAATLIVPVFEEQLMRGYLLRFGTQWQQSKSFDDALEKQSVHDLEPGRMALYGVALSTIVFTAGHAMIEWPAAVAYGLLMCALVRWRRDMLSVIVAHGVTNLGLALFVRSTGAWGYW